MRADDDAIGSEDSRATRGGSGAPARRLASVDPRIVKMVVKLLLGVGALVALLALVSVLPGLDRLIPATPITFSDLIVGLFTLGIVGILVYGAPQIETLVRQEFDWPGPLVAHVAATSKYLLVLLAVFVAHWGLARAVLPFAREAGGVWAYDAAFLLLALAPTGLVTLHVYRGLDPAATHLTRKITAAPGPAVDTDAESETRSTRGSTDRAAAGASTDRAAAGASTDRAAAGASTDRAAAGASTEGESMAQTDGDSTRVIPGVPSLRELRTATVFGNSVLPFRGSESDEPGVLTKEEEVLHLLEANDGRIRQTELVEITGWSKSTVSRVLSEMAEDGRVAKIDLGQGNLIALPGEEPERASADRAAEEADLRPAEEP